MNIDKFVNTAYDAAKVDILENFYDTLIDILNSAIEGENLELAITVKLQTLIANSVIEDDLKMLLYSLINTILSDVDYGITTLKDYLDVLKKESIEASEKIIEEIFLNSDSFSEKLKKALPKREFIPYEFMRDFYICLVKETELKERKIFVDDINTELILKALKGYQENWGLSEDNSPKR